ncbi:mevalonate kinase [Actinomyces bowdenii]|uniref:mevalonate kinase n=1 Tax=Actinomyces bowdenii TaxID=131109 RepID=UPI00214ADF11|nr:mevalonate kinase [Actinomyces bowdenii]
MHEDMDPHSAPGREGHGRTWAKAILLGEHSVVYGHPAIAVALHDLRMEATATPITGPSHLASLGYSGPLASSPQGFACVARAFEAAREFAGRMDQSFAIATRSNFPHERGLGSSAAASGAIIRAVLDACGRSASAEELFALTQMAEQVAHGRPSGLDAAATCAPGPIRFQGGRMTPLSQRIEGACLVIADSGVHGSTRQAVEGLRARYEQDAQGIGALIGRLGELTTTAEVALDEGEAPSLGAAMDQAHAILAELELSLPVLDRLTAAARGAGALGAKLTGGGLGGCIIALAGDPGAAGRIGSALRQAGAATTWTYRMRTSEIREAERWQ